MFMVFDDGGVRQLPIVGCLVMWKKMHIHRFHVFWDFLFSTNNPQLHMPSFWAIIHGFQQFKLGRMRQKVNYKFYLDTIVIPSLPYNSKNTNMLYVWTPTILPYSSISNTQLILTHIFSFRVKIYV
jgi:hypothetical protein